MVSWTVEGVPKVVQELGAIRVGIDRNASRTVERACKRIVARARELVPVRTGVLKESIGYAMRGKTLGVVGIAPPGDRYWYLVEYGTVYAAAHPFMRPAQEPEQNRFTIEMERGTDAAIREVA